MSITDLQRRILVDVSDGEWRRLVPRYPAATVTRLGRAELLRCDFSYLRSDEKRWTITPDGLQALEASA
ncbi:MAG: hypothetical protein ACPGFA_01205 [Pikeienuella sp.]